MDAPRTTAGLTPLALLSTLRNPASPLNVVWRRFPGMAPWFLRMLRHANAAEVERIASALGSLCRPGTGHYRRLSEEVGAWDLVRARGNLALMRTEAELEAQRHRMAPIRAAGGAPDRRPAGGAFGHGLTLRGPRHRLAWVCTLTQDPRPKAQGPRPKTQDPRPRTRAEQVRHSRIGPFLRHRGGRNGPLRWNPGAMRPRLRLQSYGNFVMKALIARITAARPVRETMAMLDLIDRANLGLIAAGIGFFATLAVFPALAVLVLTWSLFFDPAQIQTTLQLSEEVLPPEVFRVISDTLGRLIRAGSYETLTYATIVSFLFALWSARAGVSALIRGLNAAHSLPHRANTLMRYVQAILLTLAICGTVVIAIAAIVVVPIFQAFLPQGTVSSWLVELLRWGAALFAVIMALGLAYRLGPNFGERERPGWISPGAILAAVLWLAVSLSFSVYLQNFANYNEVYGSLGAAVALLMWFYLSAYVVLMGGALNARIFHRHRDDARARRAARAQGRMSKA